jgi:hypothetical protein
MDETETVRKVFEKQQTLSQSGLKYKTIDIPLLDEDDDFTVSRFRKRFGK